MSTIVFKKKVFERRVFRNIFFKTPFSSKAPLRFRTKRTWIFSSLLGTRVIVFNGLRWLPSLRLKAAAHGSALGQLILTKKITGEIHTKNKKSKKNRGRIKK